MKITAQVGNRERIILEFNGMELSINGSQMSRDIAIKPKQAGVGVLFEGQEAGVDSIKFKRIVGLLKKYVPKKELEYLYL